VFDSLLINYLFLYVFFLLKWKKNITIILIIFFYISERLINRRPEVISYVLVVVIIESILVRIPLMLFEIVAAWLSKALRVDTLEVDSPVSLCCC